MKHLDSIPGAVARPSAAQFRNPNGLFFSRRRWAGLGALLLLLPGLAASGATTRYVSLTSPSPAPPYTTWATAAHIIQDAVDAAQAGDTVLVNNGDYRSPPHPRSVDVVDCNVLIDKAITVQSVSGPAVTFITTEALGTPFRCVYLGSGAVLSGFTLRDGDVYFDLEPWALGGGVYCQSDSALVTNCTLADNKAWKQGGGAYGGTLINCTLRNNAAWDYGGGASHSTLINCTLTDNHSMSSGGGAYACSLTNCTLVKNEADDIYGYSGGGLTAAR